tara:strand:- start:82 stop:570 length:489 start_codon:yes stop_codon:yes gene_type:complete
MIKTISFLRDGKRVFLSPNSRGKFELPGIRHSFTARQLVDHPNVKDGDPTLTLEDGKKLRVFYASNSKIPMVYPSIVIDNYDEMVLERSNKSTVKIRKKSSEERKEETTKPMHPIIPPFSGKSTANVCTSNMNLPLSYPSHSQQDDEDEDYDDYDVFGDYDW